MVLFILRHPLWLLVLLLIIAGGAIYWPMSQGVKTEELLSWYQKKYVVVKKDVVKAAKEKGMTNLVPQAIVEEVEQAEDSDVAEGEAVGENYNVKIVRDAKSKETKHILKKRGGFKKAAVSEVVKVEKNLEDMTDEEILEEGGQQGGGLADFLVPGANDEDDQNGLENAKTDTVGEAGNVVSENETTPQLENKEDILEKNESENTDSISTETEPEINLVPEEVQASPQAEPELDLF